MDVLSHTTRHLNAPPAESTNKRVAALAAKPSSHVHSIPASVLQLNEAGREPIHVAVRLRGATDLPADIAAIGTQHIFLTASSSSSSVSLHTQLLSPLLQSAFRGYNSNVVFTGTSQGGKTRATWGQLWSNEEEVVEEDQENRGNAAPAAKEDGAVAFTLQQAFAHIRKVESSTPTHSFIAAISLYAITPSDQLVDCLATSPALPQGSPTLKLQEDSSSKLNVAGLTRKIVQSKNHALRVLASVMTNTTAESKKNHLIATITLEKKNLQSQLISSAQIQFIDLASAAILPQVINSDDPAGSAIRRSFNPSLNALDKVITLLAKSASESSTATVAVAPTPNGSPRHIPYREGKLTRVLKDGLGIVGGRTHTLIVLCAHAGAAEANKSFIRQAKKARAITNVISENAELLHIAPSQSLHALHEKQQARSKARAALAASGQITSPSVVTPLSGPSRNAEMAAPVTAARVRRQLFDAPPSGAESSTPVIHEVAALATTAATTSTIVADSVTPKPTRRYVISAAKSVVEAKTTEEENSQTAVQPEVVSTPAASPPRRWKISSAKASPMESAPAIAESPVATAVPSTPACSPTRRWAFKPRAPPCTPAASSCSLDELGALRALRGVLAEKIEAAETAVEALAKEREAASTAAVHLTRAQEIEQATILMSREAAADTSLLLLRKELSEVEERIQSLEHLPLPLESDSISISLLPLCSSPPRSSSFSSPPSCSSVAPALAPPSPAQLQADEVRGAFVGAEVERSPPRAASEVSAQAQQRAEEEDANEHSVFRNRMSSAALTSALSRLSIVNEAVEYDEPAEDDEDNSFVPLPSFSIPDTVEELEATENSSSSATTPKAGSSVTRLAELMRKSLEFPAALRSAEHSGGSLLAITDGSSTPAPPGAIIRPAVTFPLTPATVNMVNLRLSHNDYVALDDSSPASQPATPAASWFSCCSNRRQPLSAARVTMGSLKQLASPIKLSGSRGTTPRATPAGSPQRSRQVSRGPSRTQTPARPKKVSNDPAEIESERLIEQAARLTAQKKRADEQSSCAIM